MMSDLEKYFRANDKRLIHKWNHYFDIYDRHFSRLRNKPVKILEIGVSQGGSLQMWKAYFGAQAKIYGVDVNPKCKELEEENVEIFIGSQSDRSFLRDLTEKIGTVDLLIDDGGHTMKQQIVTFEELYELVSDDGIYVCEDVHTSYWPEFGGGHKNPKSFIEYSKNLIDQINAFHSREKGFEADDFTRTTDSIHFYDSVVIIEKRIREKPFDEKTGSMSFEETLIDKAKLKAKYAATRNKTKVQGLFNKKKK